MGLVCLVQQTRSRALLAVKVPLTPCGLPTPQAAATVHHEHMVNETFALGGLDPHVVAYHGPIVEQGQLNGCLTFEWLPGGSLASNLR